MAQTAQGDGAARRVPGTALALAEMVELLSAPIDVTAVQQRVVDRLRALLGTRIAVLYGRARGTTDLITLASSGEVETASLASFVFPHGTGAVGRAMLERQTVVSANVLTDPEIVLPDGLRPTLEQMGVKAVLAVPLVVEDEVLGALVTREYERTFEVEEVRLAEAFAAVAARAIRNTILQEETARGRREAEVMAEVGRALNAVLTLDDVLQLVADRARELCQSDLASISLREDTDAMTVQIWSGPRRWGAPLRAQPGKGVTGQVLASGRPFRTDDYARDPRIARDYLPDARAEGVVAVLVVPVEIGGRVEGLLYVHNRSPRPFTERDETVLVRLAALAATAIASARLYEQVREQLFHTETLLAVSRSVGTTLDMTETMRRVARHVAHALEADMVGAYVPDPTGEVLQPLAGYHVPPQLLEAFRTFAFRLKGQHHLQEAIGAGKPIFIADPRGDPRVDQDILERFPPASVLFVPMIANGEFLGALLAAWWTPRDSPTPKQLSLVEAIGQQSALAASNAQLFGVSERRRKAARTLGDLVHLISSSLDPAVVAQRIVESIRQLLEVPSAMLMLREPGSDDLVVIATSGASTLWDPADLTLESGMGAVGLAVRTRQPIVTNDVLGDPRIAFPPAYRSRLEATGIGSALAVPMMMKGEAVGGLSLGDRRGRLFDPEAVLLAQTFADEAALALEHARLFTDLQTTAARLEGLSRRLVEGLEEQRQHLARELHDEVGQLLTGITLALDTAARSAAAPTVEGLMHARELVNGTISRVREMALNLRPPMLDDLGLLTALVWHFERFARQTGLTVDFKQRGLDKVRAPAPVESALYRIAQEALTNVARHSGARVASVRLSIAGRFVRLDVEDQGSGFDAARALGDPRTIGLSGMRERARLLGGELRIDSAPTSGTTVSVTLPLDARREPGA